MNRTAPFYLFMLLVILSPLAIDVFLPAIPLIALSLNASLVSVQATVAVFLATAGIGQIVAGPLADKYGRRPLALAGISLYLAGGILASMAWNIEVLLLSRVLQGLGACAVSVSAISGIRDSYGPERSGTMYSYVNGVICVIPALAPLLGGFLTEIGGWRYNFYFISITAVIIGIIMIFKLPETRPAETKSSGKLISLQRYKSIIVSPIFRFHTGYMMLAMAIIIGYVSISPAVIMVELARSPFEFSLWFGANAVINISAAFIAPRFIDLLGKKSALNVAIIACLFGGVSLIAASSFYHPLAFMLPVFICSIGFCIIFALCGGSALRPFGQQAGTASALMGFFQMTGASVLVGLLQLLPFSGAQVLAVLMTLPFIWLLFWRTQHHHEEAILESLNWRVRPGS